MRTAQELIDDIASLPTGSVVSLANSGSSFVATYATLVPNTSRRMAYDRASNADPLTALSDGLDAALIRTGV